MSLCVSFVHYGAEEASVALDRQFPALSETAKAKKVGIVICFFLRVVCRMISCRFDVQWATV